MFVIVMAIVTWKIVKRDWSCCQKGSETGIKPPTGIVPSGSVKKSSASQEGGEYEPLSPDRHKYSSSSNETQQTTIEDYNQVEQTIDISAP